MTAMQHAQTWRTRLRRDIGWSLLIKLGLLTLLWALFFSSSHRCRVDGAATASRLAVDAYQADSHLKTINSGEERCD
jgi:hypothetical protein